jgi:hypothetical protein
MTITTQQDRGAEPETEGADDADQAGYVHWTYVGPESVFFYPPGSVKEHLVIDHGIPSVDMHWQVIGYYDHRGDHLKQGGVQTGAVGDLLAAAHPHTQAA